MDIKCSVVSSIKVNLLFDDKSTKEALIAVGDLVSIIYNANLQVIFNCKNNF